MGKGKGNVAAGSWVFCGCVTKIRAISALESSHGRRGFQCTAMKLASEFLIHLQGCIPHTTQRKYEVLEE